MSVDKVLRIDMPCFVKPYNLNTFILGNVGKNSSTVPVDYTLRKYVKKPSGAAPGKVIYTHQKTVYVTAEEEEIRRIPVIDGQ